MGAFFSIFRSFFYSSLVRRFGGVFGGALFALFSMRLWSSLGSKYTYMVLGGVVAAALILVIIYLLWKNLQVSRSKKMAAALEESVQQKKQKKKQLKTAIGSLKDKWQTAMDTLKAAKIDIYDIPWVLLIGEPQSGKTTTLKRSGLDFPIGKDALSGAGGTVNCDWWFTNDAVVIDTAGRFTMPVDSAPDKDEWQAFLKLLVKYRPKCPVNNIIVTIPATSFLEDDTETLEEKAGKIREKLLEITTILGVEFPVYIMVSKSDLINGFTEFCASLSAIENTQILGWNEGVAPTPFNSKIFNHHFDALRQRFYKWSLRRLRDLPVGKEADQIFSFHTGFNGIKHPLESYLRIIFKEDKFHAPLIFRGCFFSSGLQEGQAIVKALETGNASGAERFSDSFSKSRPYFIYNFYRKVFLENGLVRRVGAVTRREKKLKALAIGIACLFSMASIWYLWTGYSMLTRVLKPAQTRAAHVMKEMNGASHKVLNASDVVKLAQDVALDRRQLESESISYRFLRGKNNALIMDMKNIEDAILLKALFYPIIGIANQNVVKHPKVYADKVQMMANLTFGLGALVNSPRELYSLAPDILIAKKHGAWMNLEPDRVAALAKAFPNGDLLTLRPPDLDASRLHIRQEISGLNQFWKTYPEKNWNMLKTDLINVMTQYRAMLDTGRESEPSVSVFANAAKQFISAADKLLEYKDGTDAMSPGALFAECQKDYQDLSLLLEKAGDAAESTYFQPTVARHSDVCRQTNDIILLDLAKQPELMRSLITKDGRIHPQFQSVLDIVKSALAFGPLFVTSNRDMVLQNPERIVGFIDAWDTEWHAKKTALETRLLEDIKQLTGAGWQKKSLESAIGRYLSDEIWEADLKAALTAISAILKGNALSQTTLIQGATLPNAARTKWLEEKFALFAKINAWLIQKYPSRPDISRGTRQITASMTDIYKDYLTFWDNTLKSYDPSRSIVRTHVWKDYRQIVLAKRGLFLDPGAWPFNMFLENVTMEGLNSLKQILGEDRDTSIIKLERNISRTAFVYSMASGNLGILGSAQDRFYQCVDALSDRPSEALTALNDGLMKDFKSLSSFRNRVDSGLGGGEILAGRLERIQRHGLNILKKGYASGFQQDQKDLIGKWYGDFRDKYPFTPKKDMVYSSTREGNLISFNNAVVTNQDFYDFCFDNRLGLDRLVTQYNLRQAIEKNPDMAKYQFVKAAIQWQDFIYDKNNTPIVHTIKLSIADEESSVSKNFTVLKIRGLNKDKSKNLRLRFSGKRYKTTEGVWHIDQDTPVYFLVENEETRKSSKMILLENHFAFPAHIVNTGKKLRAASAREWLLPLDFYDEGSKGNTFRVNLIIEWDESLPGPIPLWSRY